MKNFVAFLFILCCHIGIGQNQEKIDSLEILLSKKTNDTSSIKLLNLLSREYTKAGNPEKGQKLLAQSLLILSKTPDSLMLADTYFYQGDIFQKTGDYSSATQKILKSYDIYKGRNNKRAIQALNIIGIINARLKNNEKAYKYSEQAMNLAYDIGDSVGYYKTMKNLAIINKNMKKYEEAILFNKNAARYELSNKDFFSLGKTYNNLAIVYEKTKEYDLSFAFYEKSLNLKKKYGSKTDIINSHLGYSNLYNKVGQLEKSKFHVLEAKKIAEEGNYPYELMHILNSLSDVSYKLENYKTAFDALQSSKIISDSLTSLNLKTNIAEIETKYQTQQKENEILQLTNDNLLKDADLAKSKMANFGVLGIFVLCVILGYFFWSKRQQKHKLALLENSVKTSEAEKSRIGKALHDGIAGSIMKLVHDSETAQIKLSHKLLQTYNEVRDLSHQLDNTPMHDELFFERVLDIIPKNKENLKYSFNISPKDLKINEPVGTHIFRIIQELITNNLKHAEASETLVSLSQMDNFLILDYMDNGKGSPNFAKGKGLRNIEDRIVLMNAKLELVTNDGFKVKVEIPYT